MVSDQAAHDFFLASSQIIPTLLVALFVLDRYLPDSLPGPDVDESEIATIRKSLSELAARLKNDTAGLLALLTSAPNGASAADQQQWEGAWRMVEEVRRDHIRLSAEVEASENEYRILLREHQRFTARFSRAYIWMFGGAIIFGCVGEFVSLGGALGVLGKDRALNFVGVALAMLLFTLALHAWAKFGGQLKANRVDRVAAAFVGLFYVIIWVLGVVGFWIPGLVAYR